MSQNTFTLTNLNIVDTEADKTYMGGVAVADGKITDIGTHITDGTDMNGLTLIPGIVDMRVHLKDPGQHHKESLEETLTNALHGGITHVIATPDTSPTMDNAGNIKTLLGRAEKINKASLSVMGAITKDLQGKEIAEIGLMHKAGVKNYSNGDVAISNTMVLGRAFQYASMFDVTFHMHAMDCDLSRDGMVHESASSSKLGLKGISPLAEVLEIDRLIRIARTFNTKLHISHISCEGAVDTIRQAKAEGVNITADVCHHHIALCEDAIGDYKTYTKIMPPLRTNSDRLSLIAGLKDGTIDAIVSDHKAEDPDSKRLPFAQAGFGAIGTQTLLPITLSLYHNKDMTLLDTIKLITINPSKINNLLHGTLSINSPADFAIIDLNKIIEINKETTLGKCKNTPYELTTLMGTVVQVYKNGQQLI